MSRETLKVHSKGGFTTIYNLTIRDNNLSNKSLGLLVKLLSLPENWNFSFNGIVAICKDGKSAVSTEMEELKAAGYLYIDKVRDKDGTYLYNYNVYDTPQEELIRAYKEKKSLKNKEINPEPDFPVLDNPELENQVIYQRNNIKEEIDSNKDFGQIKKILEDKSFAAGMTYARNLFYCALFCYYDRFHNFDIMAVKKLFVWAMMVRVDMQSLGFDTINRYAIGLGDNDKYSNALPVISMITTARKHTDISSMRLNMKDKEWAEKNNKKWLGLVEMLKKI